MNDTDPWAKLPPSSNPALRIDSNCPWDIFWTRAEHKKCAMALAYSVDDAMLREPPSLQGITIDKRSSEEEGRTVVLFILEDGQQKEIFYRLCKDVVRGATEAQTEEDAINIAISRMWRWHNLLRGAGDELLSNERQKGLLGELIILEEYLLNDCSAQVALDAWHGPLGGVKDFQLGLTSIEVKTKRRSSKPHVKISSEEQLSTDDKEELFLFVVDMDSSTDSEEGASNLNEVANRVGKTIAEQSPAANDRFAELLQAAGYYSEHDYSDYYWLAGEPSIFQVSDGFPRLTIPQIPLGISRVEYRLSLRECEGFLVDKSTLSQRIQES